MTDHEASAFVAGQIEQAMLESDWEKMCAKDKLCNFINREGKGVRSGDVMEEMFKILEVHYQLITSVRVKKLWTGFELGDACGRVLVLRHMCIPGLHAHWRVVVHFPD